ncbi:hypothetical protein GGTG_05187 [Gaeumannomyces tritici R3-111a-1]|uniref:Inheritance of peroxisomes protein 1 n=1 Tax=Gaeumannomyces tritici (strain R3-111a-1) TaxID=644352 RepID=J3NV74_GAET3|nr:hypothetical protein GGTG_05187 [Gaeumannomyces tritici R3-111a-1]EJT75250.1 hypothetical protein GGTG_05187 [Gaeumannomyces tritici R3-111a-1]
MDYARPPGSALATPRRVVTTPLPLQSASLSQSPSPAAPAATPSGGIETLYSHPSVKIIAFSAGPRTLFAVGASGRGLVTPVDDIEPGTLPWSSQLERTIAVGPFRIYRAPGSVAFLNCGTALQPILPKSQCWCIDEISSKFVLQIRRPQYWRIEIPIGDAEQAQALRDVFDKVLQFEKTPCPFQRAFHVELPEPSQAPVKKRPWAPTRRTSLHLPPTPISPEDLTPRATLMGERTRRATYSRNSDDVLTPTLTPPTLTPTLSTIAKTSQGEVSKSCQRIEAEASNKPNPVKDVDSPIPDAISQQHPGFHAGRSIMPPPQLSLLTSSPPRSIAATQSTRSLSGEEEEQEEDGSETTSPTDSSDSFHSMRSWNSPTRLLPPSPPLSNPNSPRTFPYPHENIPLPQQPPSCQEQMSADSALVDRLDECAIEDDARNGAAADDQLAACASPSSDGCSVVSFEDASQAPATPTSTTSVVVRSAGSSRSNSPPRTRPRLRRRATSRSSISSSVGQYRALSPLPPGVNLFNPSRFHRSMTDTPERAKTRMEAVRRIPSVILNRTCEILLSPPGNLVNLMLKVAARIAAGEWRGLVFGIGEGGEQIPVQWDYSDSDSPGMPGQWGDMDSSFLYAESVRPATRGGWESGGSLGRKASAILRSTSPAAWSASNDDDGGDGKHPDDGLDGDWSQRWTVD